MDWIFHLLFGLVFYNRGLSLGWFLLGNVLFDVFFIISFISVAGVRPRSLNSMLSFEKKAGKTIWHKIGYFGHGLPALVLFVALSFFVGIQARSLLLGVVLHQLVDFCTHKKQPNPLLYPFSERKYPIGFVTADIRDKKLFFGATSLAIILLVLKYLVFGFII